MAFPDTEYFDSVTAPALPSGFNSSGSTWTTATSDGGVSPVSSPNLLVFSAAANTTGYLTNATIDTNSGDVSVSCDVDSVSSGNLGRVGVTARGSSATLGSGTSCYAAYIDENLGNLVLSKFITGTETQLNTVGPFTSQGVLPTVTLACHGTTISASLQRRSDGYWLTSGATWQSGAVSAISLTNSAISGAGYAGVYGHASSTGSDQLYDNWSFSAYAAGVSATIGPTEGHDSASLTAYFTSVGVITTTEAHDTASMVAAYKAGVISGVESHDTGSFSGGFKSSGAISRQEQGDVGRLSAVTPNAILTRLEGGDAGSIAGVFTAPGSIASTESGDTASIQATTVAGAMSPVETHDIGSIACVFTAPGAISSHEGHDLPAILATLHNGPTLVVHEAGDTAALVAAHASPGHIAAQEAGDRGAISGAIETTFALACQEAGDRGAIKVVALGVPPAITASEAGDLAAILGSSPTVQYHVYCSPMAGLPIDYSAAVASTGATTWSAAIVTAGAWSYGVRAFDVNGEEDNIDCAVTVVLDDLGRDITNLPLPPMGLRAFPQPGSSIQVEWFASKVQGPKATVGFNVYLGTGTTPNYAVPAATVLASQTLANGFTVSLADLTPATPYTVGVRAYNGTGIETNTTTVQVTTGSPPPSPVVQLTAQPSV